jgi:PadR family transcriptional regulator PadR
MTRRDILPGTLDMLILRTLSLSDMHGYGIAQHIHRVSNEVLQVDEGSLYPALQRMRQKGWIKAEWRQSPNNQRAKYYALTTSGRTQLGEVSAGFGEVVAAVQRVMRTR